MPWKLTVAWIQVWQWRWREQSQFKISLEVKLTGLNDMKVEDERERGGRRSMLALQCLAWMAGWTVTPIAERRCKYIWGEILDFSFWLVHFKIVLTFYAVVPGMCFVKNCVGMRCYPTTCIGIFFMYLWPRQTHRYLGQGKEFFIDIHNQLNSQSNTARLCPTCRPIGNKKKADNLFMWVADYIPYTRKGEW